jgi:hypothetical protein
MGPYDSRHLTLDPGLTALALRGLHEREGHYPFIERFRRRGANRRGPRTATRVKAAAAPAVRATPPTSVWHSLFALRGLRATRRSSSAAA